jgi:hypothetical protein
MQANTSEKKSLGSHAGGSDSNLGRLSSTPGNRGASTQSSSASKNEEPGLAEASKSKELLRAKENDFKRKHVGVVGILSWIL